MLPSYLKKKLDTRIKKKFSASQLKKKKNIFDPFFFWTPKLTHLKKKSRLRETKHLSTDADSSTDAIGGWTKNTPKPDFFEKQKKSSETQKHLEICQNLRYALQPEVSNPSGSVVSGWTNNTQKLDFFGKRKKSSKTQKLKNV